MAGAFLQLQWAICNGLSVPKETTWLCQAQTSTSSLDENTHFTYIYQAPSVLSLSIVPVPWSPYPPGLLPSAIFMKHIKAWNAHFYHLYVSPVVSIRQLHTIPSLIKHPGFNMFMYYNL